MRSDNIKITLEIPIPINKPDRNGNIYTKEAIENAINNFKGPIPLELEYGKVAGHINTLELNKNFSMTAKGIVYFGGSNENADLNDEKIVTKMNILAIGLDKN